MVFNAKSKEADAQTIQGNPPPVVRQSDIPSNPIDGLLWYDLSTGRLKKFKNNSFETVNKQLANRVFGIFDTGLGDWNPVTSGGSVTTQTEDIGQTFSDDVAKMFASKPSNPFPDTFNQTTAKIQRTFDFSKFNKVKLRVDFNTNKKSFRGSFGDVPSRVEVKVNGGTQFEKSGGSSGQSTISVDLVNTNSTGRIQLIAKGLSKRIDGEGVKAASATLKGASILLNSRKPTVAGSGSGGTDSDL